MAWIRHGQNVVRVEPGIRDTATTGLFSALAARAGSFAAGSGFGVRCREKLFPVLCGNENLSNSLHRCENFHIDNFLFAKYLFRLTGDRFRACQRRRLGLSHRRHCATPVKGFFCGGEQIKGNFNTLLYSILHENKYVI